MNTIFLLYCIPLVLLTPLFEWLLYVAGDTLPLQYQLPVIRVNIAIISWVPVANLILCLLLTYAIGYYYFINIKVNIMLWWMQTKIRKIMKKHGSKG